MDLHVATGTYYARLKRDGNTIRHAVGQNKAEAIEAKEAWLKELRGAPSRVQGTLGSLVEKYLKWLALGCSGREIIGHPFGVLLEVIPQAVRQWDAPGAEIGRQVASGALGQVPH